MNALVSHNIEWHHYYPCGGPSISPRYSHSACCLLESLYIFGGCTIANTTFNDLWRFDLETRCWIRPIATGTFPPPKACASFVAYGKHLILFGGWSHSSPFPIHQEWRIFNHVHSFDTDTNRWTLIESRSHCPPLAGHSACIMGDEMIVFGGLQNETNFPTPFSSSNDVWVFNLKSCVWRKQMTSNPKPHPRYGHSHLTLDANRMLIIGGCGGPNMLLNDIWMLTIPEDYTLPWEWKLIDVSVKDQMIAPQICFHHACRVRKL